MEALNILALADKLRTEADAYEFLEELRWALVSRETGEVRSQVVANVRGGNLRRVIAEQVDSGRTHLHTDSAASYAKIADQFASHSTVERALEATLGASPPQAADARAATPASPRAPVAQRGSASPSLDRFKPK